MSLKKKLAMGVATGALAVSMIGGGTYAYFNDIETSVNTFAAGTLDLALNPTTIINIDNLKPGDSMNRTFELQNNGSLDILEVFLTTDYFESVPGLGDQIVVEFLKNIDKNNSEVFARKTLRELKELSADAVNNTSPPQGDNGNGNSQGNNKKSNNGQQVWFLKGEKSGLKSGTIDHMAVKFIFKDEGDQNAYQGANLTLNWTFTANQTAGESK